MKTDRLAPDAAGIARAAELLRDGGLVAFPTETVYGLGARADVSAAVRGIFAAKGRSPQNPLIVHVADVPAARALAADWPPLADALARAFWPGALTIVCALRADAVAEEVTAGGATVAVRVPAHPVALALLTACGLPIAAPSANRSTAISPTTAEHVLKTLDGRIDLVVDGGATGFGIESTIVDVTTAPASILRHGAISVAELGAHGPVVDRGGATTPAGERARAPGTSARHYAPRASLVVVSQERLAPLLADHRARGEKAGAILRRSDLAAAFASGAALDSSAPMEALPDEPAGYARELYAALHRLDDRGCDAILVAEVPVEPAWVAVRDRLRRASAAP